MLRVTILAFVLLSALPVGAQQPDVFEFAIEVGETTFQAEIGDVVRIPFTLYDHSRDSPTALGGPAGPTVNSHRTTFKYEFQSDRTGWGVSPITQQNTQGGDVKELEIRVSPSANVRQSLLEFSLLAEHITPAGREYTNVSFTVITPGVDGFSALAKGPAEMLAPGDLAQVEVRIVNGGLVPRIFAVEVTNNPCGFQTGAASGNYLEPKTSTTATVDIRAPEEKFMYLTESCIIDLVVYPLDNPSNERTLSIAATVNGPYLDPVLGFYALGILLLLLLLILFILRRKAAIEEELLGKPQRPWTIPVERVYLEHLEARDPRAAYVVRHFLMEEEYASALLWYKGFKKATRGERAKESLVVRQEKAYARFRRKWERKIAAPMKEVDKLEASLQKKLDRNAKGEIRKERRAWKKTVAKLEQAHAAQYSKAMSKWEKDAKKAEKKGQPVPPQPEEGAPDLPPEPAMDRVMLADHKWQKKVDKARRKAVKKQGDLEVKFEKKDARMLHKVQKKVHKIAKKIDDPDFAAEHPLVGQKAD